MPCFCYLAWTWHSSYTVDLDNMVKRLDNVRQSCWLNNDWYIFPVAVLFSGEMLTVFSICWFWNLRRRERVRFCKSKILLELILTCVCFETMSLSVLPLDLNFSKDPCVCWHSDICPVWIHFLIFPIVLHCTPVSACDQHLAYEIVSQMV